MPSGETEVRYMGHETDEMCHKAALLGYTVKEMCAQMGICDKTFHKWKREKEGFRLAYKSGVMLAMKEVENSLREAAIGYKDKEGHRQLNTSATIFYLKNRNPTRWQDMKSYNSSVEHSKEDYLAHMKKSQETAGGDKTSDVGKDDAPETD